MRPALNKIFLFMLVFAAAVAIYLPGLRYPLVWDDIALIQENQYLRPPFRPALFFRPDFWQKMVPLARNDYRPFQMTALALIMNLAGPDPAVFRLINIIFHLCAGILAWVLAQRVFGLSDRIALVSAAIFLLHPVQVEAVINPRNISELLCACLLLGALLIFQRGLDSGRLKLHLLSAALLLFALLTKESALVFPLLVFFLVLARGKGSFRYRVSITVPFWILSAAAAAVKILSSRGAGVLDKIHPVESLLTASRLVTFYLRMLAFPARLQVLYPFFRVWDLSGVEWMISLVLMTALVIVVGGLRKRDKLSCLALGAFLVCFLPALTKVGLSGRLAAEQRMYLPSVFFIFFVTGTSARLLAAAPFRSRLFVIPAVVAVIFSFLSADYVRAWKSDLSLWTRVVSLIPQAALARHNLAVAHYSRGETNAAVAEFLESIRLDPDQSDSRNNLGVIYLREGRLEDAARMFQESLSIDSRYWPSAVNLADVWIRIGQPRRAEEVLRVVIEENPWLSEAYNALGISLEEQERPAEAEEMYLVADRLNPLSVAPLTNLAVLLLEDGRFEESSRWAREVLRRRPDHLAGWLVLIQSYVARGSFEEAERVVLEGLSRLPEELKLKSYLWALRSARGSD